MLALCALAALLGYPDPDLRAALPEIADALRTAPGIPPANRDALAALIDEIASAEELEAEARYVDLFDRGHATSLNLFEHLHGETRDRGQAMAELKQVYERAGFTLTARELPDYLPVLLEYLSQRDRTEIKDMLGDCAHIVRSIGEALVKRESRYAAVLDTVLRIAGEGPLDRARAARRPAERRDPDRDWAERPAFETDAAAIGGDARSGFRRRS
ncbi:MAG: nitrate reductase molybdenum cofactor assembly chaperone [Acetobacteraceae bacterium]